MIYIIQGDTFLFLKTGKFQTAAFGAAVSFWIKNGILVGNLKCPACRSAVFWHPWFSSKPGWILFIQLQVIQPFAEILDGFFDGILCCLHGKSGKIIRVTGSPQDLKKGLVGQYPSGSKSFVGCFCLLQLIKNKFLQICQFFLSPSGKYLPDPEKGSIIQVLCKGRIIFRKGKDFPE